MKNKHSIVIPTFNRPQKLRRALMSCLEQSVTPAEILVIDNGQNPETPVVVQAVEAYKPADCELKYIQSEPFKVREALATGIELASQEWIILLDDDDLLLPGRIENDESVIRELADDVVLIANDFIRVDYQNEMIWVHDMAHKSLDLYDALVLDNFPPPPAGTWRAAPLKANHSFKLPAGLTDYDMYASVLSEGRVHKTGRNGYLMDDTRVAGRLTGNLDTILMEVTLHAERYRAKHSMCAQGPEAIAFRLSQQEAFFIGKALGWKAFLKSPSKAVSKHPLEALKGAIAPLRSLLSRYLPGCLPEMRGSKTYTLNRFAKMEPELCAFVNAAKLTE